MHCRIHGIRLPDCQEVAGAFLDCYRSSQRYQPMAIVGKTTIVDRPPCVERRLSLVVACAQISVISGGWRNVIHNRETHVQTVCNSEEGMKSECPTNSTY